MYRRLDFIVVQSFLCRKYTQKKLTIVHYQNLRLVSVPNIEYFHKNNNLENKTAKQNILHVVNSLPNDKILDESKSKELADDKINAIQKLKFVLRRVENIVGKGENAGYQDFLLFQQCFQKFSFSGSLKVDIVW